MARRRTLSSLEISLLTSVVASLMAMAVIGVLVHKVMWSRARMLQMNDRRMEPPVEEAPGSSKPIVLNSNTLPA